MTSQEVFATIIGNQTIQLVGRSRADAAKRAVENGLVDSVEQVQFLGEGDWRAVTTWSEDKQALGL